MLQVGSNSSVSTASTLTTDLVQYDQSPLELKYLLESAGVIGQASVASSLRTMQPLPGVYASVNKDSGAVTIQYDQPQTKSVAGFLEPGADIRQMLAPGDLFRIGGTGTGSTAGGNSVDGSVLFGLGMTEASPGSPLLRPLTPANSSTSTTLAVVYPGEQLRLGATSYTVKKTGVAVQVVSLDCGAYLPTTGNGGAQGPCGTFQVCHYITSLSLYHHLSHSHSIFHVHYRSYPYPAATDPIRAQWHDRHVHRLLRQSRHGPAHVLRQVTDPFPLVVLALVYTSHLALVSL